jgi:hypothetical protein
MRVAFETVQARDAVTGPPPEEREMKTADRRPGKAGSGSPLAV